jgi:hypothetical protein
VTGLYDCGIIPVPDIGDMEKRIELNLLSTVRVRKQRRCLLSAVVNGFTKILSGKSLLSHIKGSGWLSSHTY